MLVDIIASTEAGVGVVTATPVDVGVPIVTANVEIESVVGVFV